jgi:enoyl-CoA hydratase/carnithine racemase
MVEAMPTEQAAQLCKNGSVAFFDSVSRSKDAKEGALAFVEKRKPQWCGC